MLNLSVDPAELIDPRHPRGLQWCRNVWGKMPVMPIYSDLPEIASPEVRNAVFDAFFDLGILYKRGGA